MNQVQPLICDPVGLKAQGIVGIVIAIFGLFMGTLSISSASIYGANCAPGSPECPECEKNKNSKDVQTMKTCQIGLGLSSVVLFITGLTLYFIKDDFSDNTKIGLAVFLFVLFIGFIVLSALLFNVTKNIKCNCMKKAFENVSLILLMSSIVLSVIPMGYGAYKLIIRARKDKKEKEAVKNTLVKNTVVNDPTSTVVKSNDLDNNPFMSAKCIKSYRKLKESTPINCDKNCNYDLYQNQSFKDESLQDAYEDVVSKKCMKKLNLDDDNSQFMVKKDKKEKEPLVNALSNPIMSSKCIKSYRKLKDYTRINCDKNCNYDLYQNQSFKDESLQDAYEDVVSNKCMKKLNLDDDNSQFMVKKDRREK
jgi:uncharacterized membrane protein